jgi:acetyltransferase-like isoleucine patch superfamily enzyme
MNNISITAVIGSDVSIGFNTVIGDGVTIGTGTTIGNNVTVCQGSVIGDKVYIESNAVLGRPPRPAKTSTVKVVKNLPPLKVGAGTTVGAGAVLYAGSVIGSFCLIGDTAVLREGCSIGDEVIIGTGVIVENSVNIGCKTKIQSGAYITAYTAIDEQCFIAPMVTTTNDNFMGRTEERFKHIKGATVQKCARVGGGSILLPGVKVAEESYIAAGSVVTRDTFPGVMYKGVPAREFKPVPERELLNKYCQEEKNEDSSR